MDIVGLTGRHHAVGTSLRRVVTGRYVYLSNPFHLRLKGVRQGSFKYIESQAAERWALYDLVADPGERTDISARSPEIVEALRHRVRVVADLVDRLWDERRFSPAGSRQ